MPRGKTYAARPPQDGGTGSWLNFRYPANRRGVWLLRYFIMGLCGAVTSLAHPPFFLTPVIFVTLPLMVWALDGGYVRVTKRRLLRAALIGWWFGFGYFVSGLYWIGFALLVEADKFAHFIPLAVVALPAGLALFTGLALGLAGFFWDPDRPARIVLLATAWFLLDWLRGHILTGFPWHSLGYIWTGDSLLHGAMAQGAALVGAYGLGFFTLLLACLPALLPRDQLKRAGGRSLMTIMPLLALVLIGWGGWRIQQIADHGIGDDKPEISLRIVQPNIAQQEKWVPGNRLAHFQKLLQLSQLPGETPPQVIVWPEAATPFFLAEQSEALRMIGQLLPRDGILITGSPRLPDAHATAAAGEVANRRVHNSILFIGGDGEIHASYDKFHLVPFGEYLPFRPLLSAIGLRKLTKDIGAFAPGSGPQTVRLNSLPPVSPLICYEIIFPAAVTDPTHPPGWIVNLTNDAWFGDTSGPPQHLAQARLRAVEEGVPVIRSANNGISAVISPSGSVLQALPLNQTGILDAKLPKPVARPPYALYQDIPLLLLSFFVLFLFTILRIREKNSRNIHA